MPAFPRAARRGRKLKGSFFHPYFSLKLGNRRNLGSSRLSTAPCRTHHPPRLSWAAWAFNEEQSDWPRQGESKVTINPSPADYQPCSPAGVCMVLISGMGMDPSIDPAKAWVPRRR